MSIFASLIILGLLAIVVLAYFLEAKRLPKKRKRFEGRDKISIEDVYHRYYSDSGIEIHRFINMWEKIAEILKIDPCQLRPTDRFDKELSPVEGHLVEDELVDLEYFIRDEAKKSGLSLDSINFDTLDDLMKYLEHKKSRKQPTHFRTDKGQSLKNDK